MKKLSAFLVCLFAFSAMAQVGINTVTPNAQLDVRSSNEAAPSNTDGMLVPKINAFPAVSPTLAQNGMLVFLTTAVGVNAPGFYYWDNTAIAWKPVGNASQWALGGNTGTSAAANFIGTTDNQDLIFRRFNQRAGRLGVTNTSFGRSGLNPATTGSENSAFGAGALDVNTTGNNNSSFGYESLSANTTGSFNAAFGHGSMLQNVSGSYNTAFGYEALRNNLSTLGNTAIGTETLRLSTGQHNTAVGSIAQSQANGNGNTSVGRKALQFATGNSNVAVGNNAGLALLQGNGNILLGADTDLSAPTASDELNIGNTIFGKIGAAAKAIGINTNTPNALLDVNSATGGVLVPRVALASAVVAAPVTNPQGGALAVSTLVYNTATAGTAPDNVSPGFYYWDGAKWETLRGNAASGWGLSGNSGTSAATNFIGTTDNELRFRVFNNNAGRLAGLNTAFGHLSMNPSSTGMFNTAIGTESMTDVVTGANNTSLGSFALYNLTSGTSNTAVGVGTLGNVTVGNRNSALGNGANVAAASSNATAIGASAFAGASNTLVLGSVANAAVGTSDVNVGIGTTLPQRALHISRGSSGGTPNANAVLAMENDGPVFTHMMSPTTAESGHLFGTDAGSIRGGIIFNSPALLDGFNFRTGGNTSRMVLTAAGDVGIGNSAPSERLHVTGDLRLENGSQAAGRLLSSDANGVATWIDSPMAGWALTGNSGTSAATNFIGTTDGVDVFFRRGNVWGGKLGSVNSSFGINALNAAATGADNAAFGNNALSALTVGSDNTAVGKNALAGLTNAGQNTAIGSGALQIQSFTSVTPTATNNTAIGFEALHDNQPTVASNNGMNNTAVGALALTNNTTGRSNVAIGKSTMEDNTIGTLNVAVGEDALGKNTSGFRNVAVGYLAMRDNTLGQETTAVGNGALFQQTTGGNNAAFGSNSMTGTTTGDANTGIGPSSLSNNTTGNSNTCLGGASNVSTGNLTAATAIGSQAVSNASHKVRIGSVSVTVIEGQVAYSFPSDARFKYNIKENVPGLDFILKLKPVTYNFNTEKFQRHLTSQMPDTPSVSKVKTDYSESSSIVHTGFLAQDIEKAAKELGYDFDGLHVPDPQNPTDNYSVAYSQFIMPMVKAIQEQNSEIGMLKAELEAQKKLIREILDRLPQSGVQTNASN